MTFGELLKAATGLAAATVAQHLQVISRGKAGFASQFTVLIERQDAVVCERPKRANVVSVRKQPARSVSLKPVQFAVGASKKETFIFVPKDVIYVSRQSECQYVMRRSASSVITKEFGRSTVTETRP